MKKVRVLKDMLPVAEKDGICYLHYLQDFFTQRYIDLLFNNECIELVEEVKSLEEKFEEELCNHHRLRIKGNQFANDYVLKMKLTQIASDHFKERFDGAYSNLGVAGLSDCCAELRKAMFGDND